MFVDVQIVRVNIDLMDAAAKAHETRERIWQEQVASNFLKKWNSVKANNMRRDAARSPPLWRSRINAVANQMRT